MSNSISLKDKRIVLTGGSGFLGSHVKIELEKESVSEIIIPRSKEYDLRNPLMVESILEGADIVIHAAGTVTGLGGIIKQPAISFYDNAIMGLHIMEESHKAKVQKLVNIGTACSYPKFAPVPLKEQDIWNGYPEDTNAPYGIAKRMQIAGAYAYKKQYNLNIVPLIIFNLYGPRDNFDLETSHVIPALIRKCLENDKLVVWGDGSPTRSFLFVEDAARAVVLATKYYNESYPVNISSPDETSIKELVDLIVELTGFNGNIEFDTTKPSGQPRRCADVQLAKKKFNFTTQYSIREGLKKTINWYKLNKDLL